MSPTRFTESSRTARRTAALLLALFATACSPPTPADEPTPAPTPRPVSPDEAPADQNPPAEPWSPSAEFPVDGERDFRPALLGPRLGVEPAGGVLRGAVLLRITARDTLPIHSLQITEPAALAGVVSHEMAVEVGFGAELVSTLVTGALPDGPLTLVVRSVNDVGHETIARRTFTVANRGPRITWPGATAGAVVRGRVDIDVRAQDDDGVVELALDDPTWIDDDPAADRVQTAIDTRMLPDGRHRLTATARDAHGNRSRGALDLWVDNEPARTLEGSAWFGGPVIGGRVRVFAMSADGFDGLRLDLCPDVGCSTDRDGAFEVELRDGYDGPTRVRVVADGDGGTIALGPLADGLRAWPATARLSALMAHPAVGPVRVHGVTTLLDATVTAQRRMGQSFDRAFTLSSALWGEHTCAGCDPAATQPEGAAGHRALSAGVRLGLFDGGLFELAARQTANAEALGDPMPTTPWDLLRLLRRDLTDGVLDGFRRGNDLSDPRVGPFTLRGDLAAAIDRLLAHRPDWLDMPRALLRGEAGWLERLAARRSPLWRIEPAPAPLDVTPPSINILSPLPGSAHGAEVVLEAVADDDGVPPTLHVIAPADVVVHPVSEPGRIEARMQLGAQAEGPIELRVLAEDAVGHLTEATVTIEVDHTAPELTLHALDGTPLVDGEVQFTRTDRFSLLARADEPGVEISSDYPSTGGPIGDDILLVVRGYGPGVQPVEVRAVDPAGNLTTLTFDLHWQTEGPAIEIPEVDYRAPWGRDAREVDCRRLPGDDEGPEICSLEVISSVHDRVGLPVGSLIAAEGRPPAEVRVMPPEAGAWPGPVLRIHVRDETGRRLLERRALRPDGVWTEWQVVASDPEGFPVELAQPQVPRAGASALSGIENVQLRATDATGQVTVRGLHWRRRVLPPPLAIRQWQGYAERDSATTPGGYGFSADQRSLHRLTAQGGASDGINVGMWRVHNPWPIAVKLRMNTTFSIQYRRSRAYRMHGLVAGRPSGCGADEFYLGIANGERIGDCAESPWALVASGERLLADHRQPHAFVYRDADGRYADVPDTGVTVQPGTHLDIYLRPSLPDIELLPAFEVAIDARYLFSTSGELWATFRWSPVDRDILLRWRSGQINMAGVLPEADPADGFSQANFEAITFDHAREALRPPAGLEQR